MSQSFGAEKHRNLLLVGRKITYLYFCHCVFLDLAITTWRSSISLGCHKTQLSLSDFNSPVLFRGSGGCKSGNQGARMTLIETLSEESTSLGSFSYKGVDVITRAVFSDCVLLDFIFSHSPHL